MPARPEEVRAFVYELLNFCSTLAAQSTRRHTLITSARVISLRRAILSQDASEKVPDSHTRLSLPTALNNAARASLLAMPHFARRRARAHLKHGERGCSRQHEEQSPQGAGGCHNNIRMRIMGSILKKLQQHAFLTGGALLCASGDVHQPHSGVEPSRHPIRLRPQHTAKLLDTIEPSSWSWSAQPSAAHATILSQVAQGCAQRFSIRRVEQSPAECLPD